MTAKIILTGLQPHRFQKLAEHPAVEEIENAGMDEGRFFVHLKAPWTWADIDSVYTKSFGSIIEARQALNHIYVIY